MRAARVARVARRWLRGGGALLAALLVLAACRRQLYEHVSEGRLRGATSRQLWDFLADFSNTKILQPYLESFHVVSEGGNYDHWRYSVRYEGRLPAWPRLRTATLAHLSVRARGDTRLIHSDYTTCLRAAPALCLRSEVELATREAGAGAGAGALYRELVRYECPPALSYFCRRQVQHSRAHYFQMLRQHFE